MPRQEEKGKVNPVQKSDWRKKFNYKFIVKNIRFFIFLGVLAVLYIYNGHYVDKLVRKIAVT